MAGFNLTAQLNLQGPSNVRKIVSDIQRQLGTIKGTIDFTLNPGTARNVTQLNSALKTLNTTFTTTNRTAVSAANAISQFNAAVSGINTRSLTTNIASSATATQKLTSQQRQASKAIDESAYSMQEFGKQSQLAIKRFIAYSAAAGPILAVANAARKGISAFIEFDSEVVKLQQVTGESAGGLKELTNTITSLSSGLGVSSSELVNVSSTLAQAGLSARDTEKALKALALSSLAPSFDNMNQTVEGSIALMRQFGIQAGSLEGALGSVNAVAARFAVEASDIIAAIQRTGGVFASASKGVSEGTDALNEFIAVFTSIRATTRESAETIATGLRTIFTRIQRGGTIDALKEYGVNLTDLDGKFVGAYKAVELLSKGLNQLDPRDIRFSKIVEELGGFRQIGKVIPLIQQFATAQEALAVAQQGQGSLTEDAAVAQLALANQISKVREEFLALFRDIGASDTFQTLAKGALQLTSAIIGVADSVKGVLPVLALIGSIKGTQALLEFGYGFTGRSSSGSNRKNTRNFATGGYVPGVGDTDSIPANLTPGEYVMSKRAVRSIGVGNLNKMNKAGGGKISDYGGAPAGTTINNRENKPVGISNDTFSYSGFFNPQGISVTISYDKKNKRYTAQAPAGSKVSLTKNDIKTLFKNNKASATRFEEISRGTLGGTLANTTDPNYPIDIIDGQKLYDTKLSVPGNYKEKEAVLKVLNYKLDKANIGYQYNQGSQAIKLSRPSPRLLGANLTPASDPLKARESFSFVYPKFENIQTKDIQDLQTDLQNRYETFSGLSSQQNSGKNLSDAANRLKNLSQSAIETYQSDARGMSAIDEISGDKNIINLLRNYSSRSSGGIIQKFATAGVVKEPQNIPDKVAELAAKKQLSIQDVILSEFQAITGARLKRDLGIPNAVSLPRVPDLRAGVGVDKIKELVNRYLHMKGIESAAKAEQIAKMRKVAIAGLFPLDYSKDFDDWTLEDGRQIYGMVRGFGSEFLDDIQLMQQRTMAARDEFAINVQNRKALGLLAGSSVQGPIQPLAIDFDETLALGTKMVDAQGEEDLAAYRDPTKVADSLAKARPTTLAQRMAEIEKSNPGVLRKYSRILTARPQETASIIAATLNRFGLPYLESDITGLAKGLGTNIPLAKANDLGIFEKLIDDSEANVKAVRSSGKNAFQYGEVEPLTSAAAGKIGQSNVEASILEGAIGQQLGYPIDIAALERNRAVDFPQGLGRAAQYFGIPPNIETEIKRTLDGDAFFKARGEFSRYFTENPSLFSNGGLVQFFADAGEIKDRSTKNRRRGAYGARGFVPLNSREYEAFADKAYAEAGPYGGPGWGKSAGVPMPKVLADYAEKINRYVFETGGAGLSIGKKLVRIPDNIEPEALEALKEDLIRQYDGWYAEIEEVMPFGKAINTSNPITVAKNARMQAAAMAEAGNAAYTQAEDAISGFKKTGILAGFDPSIESHIKTSFPAYIKELESSLRSETDPDEKSSIQRKLKKAQAAWPDYQSLLSGTPVANQGRITGLSETLNTLLERYGSPVSFGEIDNIIKAMGSKLLGKASGGLISSFASGGKIGLDDIRKTIEDKYPDYKFRINPKSSGFGYRMLVRPASKDAPESLMAFDLVSRLSDAPALAEKLIGRIQEQQGAQKFASGGYIPAMVSNGEAFVPPETAQKIGFHTLNRMNQADRNGMGQFAGGGDISLFKGPGSGTSDSIGPIPLPVGGFVIREAATRALGLSRKGGGPIGQIRSFAVGGNKGVPVLGTNRPDIVSRSTVAVSPDTIQGVATLIDILGELGSVAKNSADLIKTNGEISYKVVEKALVKDIERLKISGAGIDKIAIAEKLLSETRNKGKAEVDKQKNLQGLSSLRGSSTTAILGGQTVGNLQAGAGAGQQAIETQAQMIIEEKIKARGGKVSDKQRAKIVESSYVDAASQITGVNKKDFKAAGIGGSDIQQYIAESMRDRKTLSQMDKQLIAIKQEEVRRSANFSSLSRTEQQRLLQQAKQTAEQEIKTRREIVNQLAAEQGRAGVGDGSGSMASGLFRRLENPLVALGLSSMGSLLGSGTPGSSSEASQNAGIQSGISTLSQGLFLSGQVASILGPVAGGATLAASALASIASAFKDGRNAFIEFEKNLRSQRLQNTLEALGNTFAQLEKDVKNLDLQNQVSSQLVSAGSEAQSLNDIVTEIPKAFWVNMFDAAFSSNQREASDRSRILEKFGISAYLSSTSAFGSEDNRRFFNRQLIPEQALANARSFSEVGLNTRRFIENRADAGASLNEIMNSADFAQFARNIALSNVEVQKQILAIQNSTSANKEAEQQAIITRYAESETIKIAQAASRRRNSEGLDRETRSFSVSIQRISQNMQDVISVINSNLTRFNEKIEYTVAAMSGQARSGQVSFGTLDVLRSPNAFSGFDRQSAADRAGSLFGGDQKLISSLLVLNKNLEENIMRAIDSTIANNPSSSDTKIGLSIDQAVQNTINQLNLPDAITKQLSREIGLAVDRLRQSGKEKIDFEALKNEVPQLENIISSTRVAQEGAIKALENWQNQLNELTQAMNKSSDLQISAADRRNQAEDIVINSSIELAKALGRNFSAGFGNNLRDRRTARLTGGATSPEDISNRLRNLTQLGESQSASLAAQSERSVGDTGSLDSIVANQRALRQTNNELRQTQQALKNLAENSEAASLALSSIQETQQRQQGRVALIEKLVSSTPEELYKFSAAADRLQKIARGQPVNQTSDERRETLSVFNDIAPMLGSSLEANNMRANMLESMLSESGVGLTPQFQAILNALRDPQTDPATQKAIEEYSKAIDIQSRANIELAKINTDLADQIADASARALKDALTNQVVKFESTQLADIARGLRSLTTTTQNQAAPPVARADGGIIYAATGTNVPDFAPRGTDTVPAMLTPGEFVVNRSATQKNLPLLNAINNGYSKGGRVSYYQDGGYVSSTLREEYQNREPFKESKGSYMVLPENIGEPEDLYTWNKVRSVAVPSTDNVEKININSKPNDQLYIKANRQLGYGYTGFRAQYDTSAGEYSFWRFNPEGSLSPSILKPLGRYYLSPRLLELGSGSEKQKLVDQTGIPNRTEIEDYTARLNNILKHLPSKASRSAGQGTIEIDGSKIIVEDQKFAGSTGQLTAYTKNQEVVVKNLAKSLDSNLNYGLYTSSPMVGLTHSLDSIMDFSGDHWGRFFFGSAAQTRKESSGSSESLLRSTSGGKYALTYNPKLDSLFDPDKLPDIISALKSSQEALANEEFATSDKNTGIDKQNTALRELYIGTIAKQILEGRASSNQQDGQSTDKEYAYKFGPEFANASKLTVYGVTTDEWTKSRDGSASYLQRFQSIIGKQKEAKYWDPDGTYKTPFDIAPRSDLNSKKFFPWVAGDAPDLAVLDAELKERADATQAETYGKQGDTILKSGRFKFNELPFTVPYAMSYVSLEKPKKYDAATGTYTDENLLPNGLQKADIISSDNLFRKAKDDFPSVTAITDATGSNDSSGSLGYVAGLIQNFVNQSDRFKKYFGLIKTSYSEDQPSVELQKLKSQLKYSTINLAGSQSPFFGFLTGSNKQYTGYDSLTRPLTIGDVLLDLIDREAKNKTSTLSAIKNQRYSSKPEDSDNKTNFKLSQYPALAQGLIYSAYDLFGSGKTYEMPNSLGRGWFSPRMSQRYNSIFEIQPELIQDYMKQLSIIFGNQYANLESNLSRFVGTPEYDKAIETMSYLQGAQKAFFMIGDPATGTSVLGGLLDRSMFDDRVFDQAEKEAITNVFKSLGASGKDSRIRSRLLDTISEDEKVDWERQLTGSRINDPKTKNSATQEFGEVNVPQTFNDLFDLGINPYNQFTNRNIRKSIFDRFLSNIATAQDRRGRPLFSTSGGKEFGDALSNLRLWYGGNDEDWQGLDYLYDKNIKPIENTDTVPSYNDRWNELNSFNRKDNLYKDAETSHSLVGGREKFGELPPLDFYKDRGDEIQYRRTGGIIYASQGSLVNFEPRGTDTVPAMLTPGEFVVNRSATQKHLPLLRAINDGAKGYSSGGVVYLSSGGLTPAQETRFNELSGMSSRNREEENEYIDLKNKRMSGGAQSSSTTTQSNIQQSRRTAVRERNQRMALMAIPPNERTPEQQERYNALIAKRDKDRPEIAKRNANYRASQAYNAEAERRSNERLVNQYADEYRSSGSELSPEEWAAQNKPGMRGQRLDGFLARVSGSDYDYGRKMTDQEFADAGTANRARLDASTQQKAQQYTSGSSPAQQPAAQTGSKPMLPPSEQEQEPADSTVPSIPAPPAPAAEPPKPAPAPAVEPPKPAPAPAVEPPKPAPAPAPAPAVEPPKPATVPAPVWARGGTDEDPFAERAKPSPADAAKTRAEERRTASEEQQTEARKERRELRRAAAQQREDIIAETRRRLEMTISREEATIKDKAKNREESGWWAASMRGMGLMSDPYEAEMAASRQRITAARMGLSELKTATVDVSPSGYVRDTFKVENFNAARRLAGLDEVTTGVDSAGNMTVSRVEKDETEKANDAARRAADTAYSRQLMDNEQSQITAARDISIDSVLAVGGVATGVAGMATRGGTMALQQAGKIGLRQVAKTAALEGAAEGLAGGTTRAIDDVTRGAKTTQEGISSALLESTIGGVAGSVLGPAFSVGIPAAGRVLSGMGSFVGDMASPITKPIGDLMSSTYDSISRGLSGMSDYLDLPTQSRYSALLPSDPKQAKQYRALVSAGRGPREAIEELDEILRTGSNRFDKQEEAFAQWTSKNLFDFVGMQPGSLVSRLRSNPLDGLFDNINSGPGIGRPRGSLSEIAGVDKYRIPNLSDEAARPVQKMKVTAAQVTEYQKLIDSGMNPASAQQQALRQTSTTETAPATAAQIYRQNLPRAIDDPSRMEQGLYRTQVRKGSYDNPDNMNRWFYPKNPGIDMIGDSINTGYKPRFAVKEGKMNEMIERMAADERLSWMLGPSGFKQQPFGEEVLSGRDNRFLVLYSSRGTSDEALAITQRMEEIGEDLLFAGGAKDYGDRMALGKFGSTRYDPDLTTLTNPPGLQKTLLDLRQRWLSERGSSSYDPDFAAFDQALVKQQDYRLALYEAGKRAPGTMMDKFYKDYPDLFPSYAGDISYSPASTSALSDAVPVAAKQPNTSTSTAPTDKITITPPNDIAQPTAIFNRIRATRQLQSSAENSAGINLSAPEQLSLTEDALSRLQEIQLDSDYVSNRALGNFRGDIKQGESKTGLFSGTIQIGKKSIGNLEVLGHERLHAASFIMQQLDNITGGNIAPEVLDLMANKLNLNLKSVEIIRSGAGKRSLNFAKNTTDPEKLSALQNMDILPASLPDQKILKASVLAERFLEEYQVAQALKFGENISNINLRSVDTTRKALLKELSQFTTADSIAPIKKRLSEVIPTNKLDTLLDSGAGPFTPKDIYPLPTNKSGILDNILSIIQSPGNLSENLGSKLMQQPGLKDFIDKIASDNPQVASLAKSAKTPLKFLTNLSTFGLGFSAAGIALRNLMSTDPNRPNVVEARTRSLMPGENPEDPNTKPLRSYYSDGTPVPEDEQPKETKRMSTGGIVYANNGAFIAATRGSDSVPAMLTPGEFVVNRQAAANNMTLLHAINSGHYTHGGLVKYLANGGVVQPKYLEYGSQNPVNSINNQAANSGVLSSRVSQNMVSQQVQAPSFDYSKMEQLFNRFEQAMDRSASAIKDGGTIEHKLTGEVKTAYDQKSIQDIIGRSVGISNSNTNAQVNNAQANTNRTLFNNTDGAIDP